jgi:hypothetical protein
VRRGETSVITFAVWLGGDGASSLAASYAGIGLSGAPRARGVALFGWVPRLLRRTRPPVISACVCVHVLRLSHTPYAYEKWRRDILIITATGAFPLQLDWASLIRQI